MARFSKILYVITQPDINEQTASLAMSLAKEHDADLSVWAPLPAIPEAMKGFAGNFEETIKTVLTQKVQASGQSVGSDVSFSVSCEGNNNDPLAIAIVRKVIREGFDLVIKTSDPLVDASQKGFPALDLSLLRKCPCPLWLNRPDGKPISKVAVAIDPNETDSSARELSYRLLRITESLATREKAEVTVISAWKLEHEYFLRNSPFGKLPSEEVDKMAEDAKAGHEAALQTTLKESAVKLKASVTLLKGEPGEEISKFTDTQNIDLLVMGTVARTGIPGFIIGNTAENVIQNVRCSMLAVKPQGFVSPVTV